MRITPLILALAGCNAITGDLLTSSDANPGHDSGSATDGATADSPMNFPTDMLLTNYDFDDGSGTSVVDRARGQAATLSDGTMWTQMGRNGRGISFNGATPASQYVTLPSGMMAGVDDFTISVWIKLSGNPVWARIYDIGNGLPDPQNRFMYLTTSGFTQDAPDGIHASSYGGSVGNESIIATHTFLPINVWKHIAITGSGGQRKLYIDGFPAATLESGPAIAPREMEPIGSSSWLGRSRFATDAGFPGTMDEFRIYGRVLTASEIADLAWPKQDYSDWRFDESSGASAADSSDRAVPTALANGATWTTGRLGGAVDFTGGASGSSSPHVVLSDNPLKGCTNQMTISMWVRVRELVTGARVFDFGSGTTRSLFLEPTNGTGMHIGMKSPSGTFDMATTTPVVPADSMWHHVAITMDSGNVVVLFVDGTPVKTQSSANVRVSDFTELDELYLARSRGATPYFNGGIDELRVGCRALTPDEIKNLSHP
ncbi:MAG TPA: LamG domain-containing protein [Kofleriaceae bacterium]|jgi:hypothetical protein